MVNRGETKRMKTTFEYRCPKSGSSGCNCPVQMKIMVCRDIVNDEMIGSKFDSFRFKKHKVDSYDSSNRCLSQHMITVLERGVQSNQMTNPNNI